MSLIGYRAIARLARHLLPLAGGKVAAGIEGRRDAVGRWLAWAANQRGTDPLVWVHAASVGEWLTAAPVVGRLRAARRDLSIALTYSSPSLQRWPDTPGVDHADYVPPDEPGPMHAVFHALQPAAVVFSRGDPWPELLATATAHKVPAAVIGGSVTPSSGRLAWPVRRWLRPWYRQLAYVGAASQADAERWARLGAAPGALQVTGDPRHDYVLERITNTGTLKPLLAWSAGDAVLVAGSTHPRDEVVVLAAFAVVRQRHPRARLVIVPHESGADRADRIRRIARQHGIEIAQWPGAAASEHPGLVVTAIGRLADLYAVARLAYVGGGFERSGVHAVIEPAAYAVPVVFGPRWSKSEDARRLLSGNPAGGVAMPDRQPEEALARQWMAWLSDPTRCTVTGSAARRTLTGGAGSRAAQAILQLLGDGP